MKQKIIKKYNPQKDLSHLMTKPFNEAERNTIMQARKTVGLDRPTFYHDAVVDYAARINGEKS